MERVKSADLGWVVVAAGLFLATSLAAESTSADLETQLASGAEIYSQSCTMCHYDGAGNPAAPDLKGSSYLAGEPDPLIKIILEGQNRVSVVNGKKFNGYMPKMDYLTDEEVAAVTAYVRSTMAEQRETISAEQVKALRQ